MSSASLDPKAALPVDRGASRQPPRAYQACDRCRRRKARCVVVDDMTTGADVTCLRCKRERKQCMFSSARSKSRNPAQSGSQQAAKRQAAVPNDAMPTPMGSAGAPGLCDQSSLMAIRHESIGEMSSTIGRPQDESPRSDLTERVTNTTVSDQADAINLLFEAARFCNGSNTSAKSDPVASSMYINSLNSPPCSRNWPSSTHPLAEPSRDTAKTFSRLKFVKKGWLTAQEAVTYVELFFKNMNPLSPVLSAHSGNPDNYLSLVKEEPILCTVILTISTRYHLLSGYSSLSRNYLLHHRLWRYCKSLLQNVMWGHGRGATSVMRGLGSIEGLLMMAEWHARSVYLPPDVEAWDSDDENDSMESIEKNGSSQTPDRWLEGVMEPIRRSDQMSWSLIQTATSLAVELQIFDEDKDNALDDSPQTANDKAMYTIRRRRRLRILLYVYVNRLAIRIGSTCLIPQKLLDLSPNAIMQTSTPETGDEWFKRMWLWVDLTRLMRTSSDLLFSSRATTRDLVRNNGYCRILEHFKPMLESWWAKYLALSAAGPLKALLAIDFMYTKMYIYSLALQAVAERKKRQVFGDGVSNDLSSILSLNPGDGEFIRDVIDGAKGVLDRILEFSITGSLKYLPMRIYVRMVSACIFLLKALALGVCQDELTASLDQIDRTASALRLCVVDDLHLAGVFASLLETYTRRFRQRFVTGSISPRANASSSRGYMEGGWSGNNTPSAAMPGSTLGNGQETAFHEIGTDPDWLAHLFESSSGTCGAGITQCFYGFDDFLWKTTM